MGYQNYDKLSEEQIKWVLSKSGAEVFVASKKLQNEGKIDSETMKQMNALWLNERNLPSPRPNRKDAWEKYKRPEIENSALEIFN